MEIGTFQPEYLPDLAALFAANLRQLRQHVSVLPDLLTDPARVEGKLADFLPGCPALVALEAGRPVGYLGWYWVDDFRGTGHKGAYVPEWGHGAAETDRMRIYRALYREAARLWFEAGCAVHAITLLAHDQQAEQAWFWNGFGLTGVDGIRSMEPINLAPPERITIRPATENDLDQLAQLEVEHAANYRQPPILMLVYEPKDRAALAEFIDQPNHTIWIALDGAALVGMIGFEQTSFGANATVDAPDKIAITGAFVRPAYRGRRIMPALIDAALRHYAALGFRRCSVDFESFNPDAAAFWPKYFQIVGKSVVRQPERQP